MNRTKKIIIAASLLIILLGGVALYKSGLGNDNSKKIHITIMNEDVKLYDKSISTQASTLGELLEEMKENKEILLESETSVYGIFITGMGVDEIYSQDPAGGKYWTYDSPNNAQCVKNSFCDAADILVIEDQDEFVFTLKGFDE